MRVYCRERGLEGECMTHLAKAVVFLWPSYCEPHAIKDMDQTGAFGSRPSLECTHERHTSPYGRAPSVAAWGQGAGETTFPPAAEKHGAAREVIDNDASIKWHHPRQTLRYLHASWSQYPLDRPKQSKYPSCACRLR